MVGQGQSLGSSDDVCIIFYPSPFCKPFFPLHELTWHPPPSLLCTMDVEDPPYVTIQTIPVTPRPWCCRSWGQGQWDWRWLWEDVPLSSAQGCWSFLDPWLCKAHPDVLWRCHHRFQRAQDCVTS